MVGGLAGCALAAHVRVWVVAGVAALEPHTRLVAGAVLVPGALGVAPGVGVAQEVRGTRALGPVVHRLTVGVLSTSSPAAGILTPVILSVTLLSGSALAVSLTLVATALQWVTNVGLLTPTDGSVIGPNLEMENGNLRMLSLEPRHLAVRVGAARGADLVTCEPSAVAEGVSSGAPGTAADGYMVLDSTLGALANVKF